LTAVNAKSINILCELTEGVKLSPVSEEDFFVFSLVRRSMAKTGRPRKGEPKAETEQVRVSPELKELLSDLALVYPKSTAQILDQIALAEVRELHAAYKPLIDKAKATNESAAAALQKLQEEAARLAQRTEDVRPVTPPRRARP
jgi:hypothetical protein